jgi:uncharacterized integral membrane protein
MTDQPRDPRNYDDFSDDLPIEESTPLTDSIYEGDYAPDDESDLPDDPEQNEEAEPVQAVEPAEAAPLVSVRARRRNRIDWRVLGAIIVLLLLTAFLYGSSQNALPIEVLTWWPASILVIAILWLFGSLARGRAPGAIGAAGLIGIGLSLLLATAFQVPLGSTLVGITFIAVGMGVILRGLLIRPTPIR